MSQVGRVSFAAVVLLVVLRLAIGWQLLYEGLWKIDSLSTAAPWSSEGYLKNSSGPMRPFFRQLAGDPDDLDWLNVEKVQAKWADWQRRFVEHYSLSEAQQARLDEMINGREYFTAKLAAVPSGVDFKKLGLDDTIGYVGQKQELTVIGTMHLLPSEYESLKAQVESRKKEPAVAAYLKALDAVFKSSSNLSYSERLRSRIKGDPDKAGVPADNRISQIDLYREMVNEYQAEREDAEMAFEWEHLDRVWSDVRAKNSEVAGPIKALDQELKEEAAEMLTLEQLDKGAPPEPWTPLRITDTLTIAGLTVLGTFLLLGFLTRISALTAAAMLFGFYLAMPPLPWEPPIPGPEHSVFINKNLVEVFALLALACLPSGRWFGLDAICSSIWRRRRARQSTKK